jgi:hypothetical protein
VKPCRWRSSCRSCSERGCRARACNRLRRGRVGLNARCAAGRLVPVTAIVVPTVCRAAGNSTENRKAQGETSERRGAHPAPKGERCPSQKDQIQYRSKSAPVVRRSRARRQLPSRGDAARAGMRRSSEARNSVRVATCGSSCTTVRSRERPNCRDTGESLRRLVRSRAR